MPRYRRQPTARELRERVISELKQTRLFANVSVRLLADLVEKYGLTTVPPAPDGIPGKEPAVLVVPDGAVDLFMRNVTPWPAPMAFAPAIVPIPLSIGVYLRNLGPFHGLTDWPASLLRARGPDPVRVFLLEFADFRDHLPRVIVNALDLGVGHALVS
jgi:hypothetical protein